jgi:transposase, IS5 family
MRFLGLALEDRLPDAKTIWLFREQLTQAGAIERLFASFDAVLRQAGYLAMAGQIVDATVIEARRPRLTQDEKATVKGARCPRPGPRPSARRWTPTVAGPSNAGAAARPEAGPRGGLRPSS